MRPYSFLLFLIITKIAWAFDNISSESLAKLMDKFTSSELSIDIYDEICACVKFYLEKGADPNTATSDNFRAMHLAALNGHNDLIKLLAESGAEIDASTCSQKWTPLHFAAHNDQGKTIELLLLLGADPNMRKSALEPLHEALDSETRAVHPTRLARSRSLGRDRPVVRSTKLPRSKSLDREPLRKKIFIFNNGENNYNFKRQVLLVWISKNKEEHEHAYKLYINMLLLHKNNNFIKLPLDVIDYLMQLYIKKIYPLANRERLPGFKK